MKTYLKTLFFCFFPFGVYALETYPATPNLAFGFHPYGSAKFGMQYYEYTEPKLMSISGPMYNISGLFGVKLNPLLKMDVQIYYSQDIGQNIYNGSTQDFSTKEVVPLSLKSADYYLGGVGKVAFILGDGIEEEWVSFYTGLGYRYLNNNIQNPPNQIVTYRREQTYWYMPFGVDASMWLNKNIKIKINAELRALLVGKNITHFTDLGWDNDAHFTQKNGSGSRLSLGAEFFITKKQAITLEAFFDYWGIKKSNIKNITNQGKSVGSFIEPENNTKVFGVQIGYFF
ncbi:hypothetical protein [Helicobacter cappadocius]|uniref:Outer membrane protein beta-barrel domain-containing protein n=1 Tax=Helicobacter cappadocius TaxID=3063998 RepID=A0AA90PRE6_9HELI|nr:MULTISPECIES: hypothetical protein [unclassified Helicobacter]MDO7253648.1 hypothetical protein [Helicobacter sp. faydin-H75]MDP2539576.1 hypothetical protein [Helicobacter sp. faydin-H76]